MLLIIQSFEKSERHIMIKISKEVTMIIVVDKWPHSLELKLVVVAILVEIAPTTVTVIIQMESDSGACNFSTLLFKVLEKSISGKLQ